MDFQLRRRETPRPGQVRNRPRNFYRRQNGLMSFLRCLRKKPMPTKKKAPSKRELFVGCRSLVLRVSFYLLVAVILVFNLFPFFCALVGSFRPPGLVRDVEKPGPLQYASRACSYLSGFHDSVCDLGYDSAFPQRIEGP
jgi:hypothetical protein